jgi:hypothetical protein
MNHQAIEPTCCRAVVALLAIVMAAAGCSSKREQTDEECIETPKSAAAKAKQNVKIERYGLGKAGAEDTEGKDWCRACVMSTLGYASCQRVYAEKPDESRDSIRDRARAKACADAKYPAEKCPDTAVISNLCKDEPPPEGTPDPGKALQNLYKSLGGGQPKTEAPPTPPAPAQTAPTGEPSEGAVKPAPDAE